MLIHTQEKNEENNFQEIVVNFHNGRSPICIKPKQRNVTINFYGSTTYQADLS